MDESKQVKSKKLAGEILLDGRQVVEQFNYDDYAEEELDFLIREMDARNARDIEAKIVNITHVTQERHYPPC